VGKHLALVQQMIDLVHSQTPVCVRLTVRSLYHAVKTVPVLRCEYRDLGFGNPVWFRILVLDSTRLYSTYFSRVFTQPYSSVLTVSK